jgi:Cof subfamily protein (haloacid dehalogenase superfamily)
VKSKKLIAIDLDGTLFYPKKPISLVSKKNIQFVQDAVKAGHKVIFVTSRNHEFVEKVIKIIGLPIDVVSRNGTKVTYGGEVISDNYIARSVALKVTEDMLTRHQKLMFSIDTRTHSNIGYTTGNGLLLYTLYRFYYFIQGNYREQYTLDNELFQRYIQTEDVQRLLIYFGLSKKSKQIAHEETIRLKQLYPDLEFSWIQSLIEVSSKGQNKASGILKILEKTGMSEDNVIVIGDSGNDIPMFERFKHSYCMSHAHPRVKKHARFLIKRVHHLRKVLDL